MSSTPYLADDYEPLPEIAITRWVVTLVEALLPTEMRVAADEGLQSAFETHPGLLQRWFAGVTTTIAASLPAEDPWRNLASTYIDRSGHRHTYPTDHKLSLEITGARTPGRIFGSRRDHTDLVAPVFTDWSSDIGLAAVSRLIEPSSSATIGAAGHGDWVRTHDLLRRIHDDRRDDPSGSHSTLEIYKDALQFVLHRRRVYTGFDDELVVTAGHTWIQFARDAEPGTEVLEGLLPRDESISDGLYRRRRLGR